MHSLEIEERRKKVSSLLSQSRTEEEITTELGVDQGTISRDVNGNKEIITTIHLRLSKIRLSSFL